MKTPPAHVLARLDDIIVGQEEAKDGGGTPPRHVLLQNCDDDDDDDAAFGIDICTATPELSIVTDFLHNLMKDTILGREEVRRVLAEVDRRVQEHAASQARDRVLTDANSPAKRSKP